MLHTENVARGDKLGVSQNVGVGGASKVHTMYILKLKSLGGARADLGAKAPPMKPW